MPGIYGGSVAEAVRTGAAGEARPEHRARPLRRRHEPDRARRHLLDDLLHALPRGPHVRHARPRLGRPRRLERRHVGQRQRGAELRVQAGHPARRALRPRRRVPRGDDRPVGHVGGRRARPRPRDAALRRPGQGARARLRQRVVRRPRAPDRAPVPAGPARAAAGGLVGPGPRLRGALGRAHLHRRSRHRHRPLPLQGPEGEDRRAGAQPRRRPHAADGLHRRRRVEGPRRGARAALPQRPGRPHGVAHPAAPSS